MYNTAQAHQIKYKQSYHRWTVVWLSKRKTKNTKIVYEACPLLSLNSGNFSVVSANGERLLCAKSMHPVFVDLEWFLSRHSMFEALVLSSSI